MTTGKVTVLTAGLSEKFVDEENDVPDLPSPYGLATWTEGDKAVLIYDKYDIWSFSPDGKTAPKNITAGFGRANNLTFRYERVQQDNRFECNADSKFVKANETV